MWMNKRGETRTPCILKHCGAITGALNIPAQHDAARGSLDCRGSRCEAPFVPLCLSSHYSQARRRPPEVAGWETACWTSESFQRVLQFPGCIQTKAGALVETQVFPFIIMRPCLFGCSGLCGCIEGEQKQQEKLKPTQFFFCRNAAALRWRRPSGNRNRLPFQHLKGCWGANFCCSRELSRDVTWLVLFCWVTIINRQRQVRG